LLQRKCACGGAAGRDGECEECKRKRTAGLQTKLRVNEPGDEFEREADRVAEAAIDGGATARSGTVIQRKPEQNRSLGNAAEVPPAVNEVLSSPGERLDEKTRGVMESRLGHDFGRVRVHTDAKAAHSARSIGARAYTAGQDIAFDQGQYSPGNAEGQRLLAHELVHVVQQGGACRTVQRKVSIGELPSIEELNFDDLADQVFKAIDGLGTDEEAVYAALQQLRRDSGAIEKLIQTYARRHRGANMIADIEDDFSGTELEYALQLLGRGNRTAEQRVAIGPEATTDLMGAARRLFAAMDQVGTDEEAVFATLLPFNRATQELEKTYRTIDKLSLRDRIIDEMSGTELDYALSLLSFNSEAFLEKHFPEKDRSFARKILNDILAVKGDRLDFANERELAVEISKRQRTSELMQESQATHAFAYPESCTQDECPGACKGHGRPRDPDFVPHDINFNAHVNAEAREYWVRGLDAGNFYMFVLSPAGWANPFQALVRLFHPQQSICDKTLIHCDYLTTVIHLRAFAESIGPEVFNQRVQNQQIAMNLSYWGFRDVMLPTAPGAREAGYARSPGAVSLHAVQPSSEDDLLIGDHVIFWNHLAYDALTYSRRWSGPWRLENAMLVDQDQMGNNLYEGHGAPAVNHRTVPGSKEMVMNELASAYNGPARRAIDLVNRAVQRDSQAEAQLREEFPRVFADANGRWWISEIDDRPENRSRQRRFYELRLLTGPSDPEIVGLRDPQDLTKMGWVKRPIESAPGSSPSRPKE
jgi:hypothetical protein